MAYLTVYSSGQAVEYLTVYSSELHSGVPHKLLFRTRWWNTPQTTLQDNEMEYPTGYSSGLDSGVPHNLLFRTKGISVQAYFSCKPHPPAHLQLVNVVLGIRQQVQRALLDSEGVLLVLGLLRSAAQHLLHLLPTGGHLLHVQLQLVQAGHDLTQLLPQLGLLFLPFPLGLLNNDWCGKHVYCAQCSSC